MARTPPFTAEKVTRTPARVRAPWSRRSDRLPGPRESAIGSNFWITAYVSVRNRKRASSGLGITSTKRQWLVNYSALPRSGLPGPRLVRTELPVSVSERAGPDPTASTRRGASRAARQNAVDVLRTVPDSAGDFPLQVVRSVPLLPVGHSTTTDDARLLSRLNNAESVVSILLSPSTEGIIRVPIHAKTSVRALSPLPARFAR